MKILVTGGAGFLGSHLTKRLLADGHHVTVIDNFYTGSQDNIQEFRNLKNFKFIEHDITSPYQVDCDGIFNLACPASPIQYQRNPIFTLQTSFLGVYNSLELARKNNARLLQASTSEVYGDPTVNPQIESYWGNVNPMGERACYDEGKRVAETLLSDYHRQYGVDIRIPRIFNTYGPNMDKNDGRVVSNFIVQALEDKDLTVYGDGSQTRSFCYVEDLIDGLVKLFFAEEIHQPINLGNPVPTSMLSLAEEIISLSRSRSRIIFEPIPSDDPKLREPDIAKAQSLLDWNPSISRHDGLVRTIEYFKNLMV